MSTTLALYLVMQLDQIKDFLSLTAFLSFLTLFLLISFKFIFKNDFPIKNYILYMVGALLSFSMITNAVLPTTEKAAIIIVGSEVIDSNTTSILKNIPEKYAKILEAKANKHLEEALKQ